MVAETADIFALLREVKDPEIPALDIVELGIVRNVEVTGGTVRVDITPTYSGCPAMRMIEDEVVGTLARSGYRNVSVRMVYSPAWTTDWMSDVAKEKLRASGIAPPGKVRLEPLVMLKRSVETVTCPFCGSPQTEEKSEFGSTACKSIHFCNACHQPFDKFKAF